MNFVLSSLGGDTYEVTQRSREIASFIDHNDDGMTHSSLFDRRAQCVTGSSAFHVHRVYRCHLAVFTRALAAFNGAPAVEHEPQPTVLVQIYRLDLHVDIGASKRACTTRDSVTCSHPKKQKQLGNSDKSVSLTMCVLRAAVLRVIRCFTRTDRLARCSLSSLCYPLFSTSSMVSCLEVLTIAYILVLEEGEERGE